VVSSRAFRSSTRLGLIAVYSIVFMWGGFFDWAGILETVLWSVGALLWIVLAAIFVRELRASGHAARHAGVHPSLPLLLVAPAFLWFTWMPVMAFVLVVLAYILELRHHSAGDGFLFSFGLVIFVGVFAGLSMVEVENDDSSSTLRTPSDAIFWAFASLLRINYGKSMTPETDDGRILATVVGVCAILGASLFTAQVVSWVIGSKQDDDVADEEAEPSAEADGAASVNGAVLTELAAIRAEMTALRALVEAGRSLPGPEAAPDAGGRLGQ